MSAGVRGVRGLILIPRTQVQSRVHPVYIPRTIARTCTQDGPWDVRGVRGMYAGWSVGCTWCIVRGAEFVSTLKSNY